MGSNETDRSRKEGASGVPADPNTASNAAPNSASTGAPVSAYKAAGVDIEAGDALVDRIKPMAKATTRPGVMGAIGGFGGLFDLKAAGFSDPILVSGTDGVGTKLKLAFDADHHKTVGIDLVAMCVNDLLVQGAEPLFFLDYMATGALDVDRMADVVEGIAEGCLQAGCALIGGETAEMPGLYDGNDYDLAGFSVGAVDRDQILPRPIEASEDIILLGLPSSGPHSNGYSLIRKIVADQGLSLTEPAPFDPTKSLAEALLEPTRIYTKTVAPVARAGQIEAMAHITGGGLLENIPRVITAPDQRAIIDADAWDMPPVFTWLQTEGGLSADDMLRTFNCGIGMVIFVKESAQASVTAALMEAGETPITIGSLETSPDTASSGGCVVRGGPGRFGESKDWSASQKHT